MSEIKQLEFTLQITPRTKRRFFSKTVDTQYSWAIWENEGRTQSDSTNKLYTMVLPRSLKAPYYPTRELATAAAKKVMAIVQGRHEEMLSQTTPHSVA